MNKSTKVLMAKIFHLWCCPLIFDAVMIFIRQCVIQCCVFSQVLEKHKRKIEEEKAAVSELKRENQGLIESCDELARTKQKLEHELQTKQTHLGCLQGQLQHAKKVGASHRVVC